MARPSTAARRYAEAAFELADRDGSHDRWDEDLRLAGEIVADERVAHILDNPAVPLARREKVLRDLFDKRLTPVALNLTRLLVQRGRIEILPAVAAEYGRLHDAAQGIVAATVTSAAPLHADETAAIKARVEAMTGKSVRLVAAVDPDLIGGLTVRVGDRLIDASVRGRLERLRDQLVAGSR
jgi:F-type H+-transporting ATPase subunit delta